MSWFITGTDTGVGKTRAASLLLRALNEEGRPALGYKPIACGDRMDADILRQSGADPSLTLDEINPVFFRVPAAPLAATMIENRPADLDAVRAGFRALREKADTILVEGAGGWAVPITPDYSIADLAAELALPVIVVVNNRLGALNHTLLTVAAIRARGLACHGLILNHVADERDSASISNRILLAQLLPDVPILCEIMHGEETLDWDSFQAALPGQLLSGS